jgi:hypothetical protein
MNYDHDFADVLAVYCSDGRFIGAYDRFITEQLGEPRFDRYVVPGGAAWLVLAGDTFREYDIARDRISFLVELHRIRRIILIAHEDCGAYATRGLMPERTYHQQVEDLITAHQTLAAWFPGATAEAYYAHARDNCVVIEPIYQAGNIAHPDD